MGTAEANEDGKLKNWKQQWWLDVEKALVAEALDALTTLLPMSTCHSRWYWMIWERGLAACGGCRFAEKVQWQEYESAE